MAATSESNQTQNQQQAGEITQPVNTAKKAKAIFFNPLGEEKGMAILEESANGVLILLSLDDMPIGEHAIHIHETGNCTPIETTGAPTPSDYFTNAGSHLNPDKHEHGIMNENGPHAGDLLNIHVNDNGTLQTHLFSSNITLHSDNDAAFLLDDDGSAIIIHEGADDYQTPPTGNAGDRIACAVIESE